MFYLFLWAFLFSLGFFVVGLINPRLIFRKENEKIAKIGYKKYSALVFGCLAAVSLIMLIAFSGGDDGTSQSSKQVFRSLEKELLFEVFLALSQLQQTSGNKFTPEELKELPSIELEAYDVWNKASGYYMTLAPPTARQLSDFQIINILLAIRHFREQKNDKVFFVQVFDDPYIARTHRELDSQLADAPEDVWCSQYFKHRRGVYNWNPTSKFESAGITVNCDVVNILD